MDETSTDTSTRGLARFRRRYPFDVIHLGKGRYRVHDAGSGEAVAEVHLVGSRRDPDTVGRFRVTADTLAGAMPLDEALARNLPKLTRLSHSARFALASGLDRSLPKHAGLHGPTVWLAAYKAWRWAHPVRALTWPPISILVHVVDVMTTLFKLALIVFAIVLAVYSADSVWSLREGAFNTLSDLLGLVGR